MKIDLYIARRARNGDSDPLCALTRIPGISLPKDYSDRHVPGGRRVSADLKAKFVFSAGG